MNVFGVRFASSFLIVASFGLCSGLLLARDDDGVSPLDAGSKEVAGTAEVLRSVPK